MKKLTQKKGEKVYYTEELAAECPLRNENVYMCSKAKKCNRKHPHTKNRTCPLIQLVDRLHEYESTGLSPKQIKKLVEKMEGLNAVN